MADEVKTKAVLARIEGRVQGVWYRGWTVVEANRRSLRGWVRNCSDGSVEALVAGPEANVDAMLELFWKGPPSARVTAVTRKPAEDPGGAHFMEHPTY